MRSPRSANPTRRPPAGWRRLLDGLDRASGALAAGMVWLGAVVLLGLTALVFVGVVRRYVFGMPLTWTDDLAGYGVVALVMLGAAEATRRHESVEVDLLTTRIGPRLARLAAVWGALAVLLVAGVLLHGGLEMVAFARMVGLISDGYLELPMWIPQAALPIGMAVLALVAGVRLVRLVTGLDSPHLGRQAPPSDPGAACPPPTTGRPPDEGRP